MSTQTNTMRVVTADGPAAGDLRLTEALIPHHGDTQLLVEVRAIGINRSDCKQRERGRPPKGIDTEILGIEFAGIVAAVGSGTSRFRPGDSVCGLVPGGAYAEFVAVEESHVLPPPAGVDLVASAAVPEAFLTAWTNLIQRGRLAHGESALIHGGASGVGTAAIQLARRVGADAFVTASSASRVDACVELGATGGINYREEAFLERIAELTDGAGVDVVFDIVGGPYLADNLAVLRPEGRLVVVSTLEGREATLDLSVVQAKRLSVTGSRLRSRSVDDRSALMRQLEQEVWPGFTAGDLRPVVDRVLAFEDVAEAHRHMESRRHVGKILLELDDG